MTGRTGHRHRLGLLSLLAVRGSSGCGRDTLVAILWPETGTARARRRLSHALYVLRKGLGTEAFRVAADRVWLNPHVVHADVTGFLDALDREDQERAVTLYGGPFLDGFHLGGSRSFEDWMMSERTRMADLHGGALEHLAREAEASGDHVAAARWWKARLAVDPYNSPVALHLVENLRASGDPANALRQAMAHARVLREDLDLEPPPEMAAVAAGLRKASRSGEKESVVGLHGPMAAAGDGPSGLGMRIGVRETSSPAQPSRARIAVLPFANPGGTPEGEVLSDGITLDLIHHLAKVRTLRVTSGTSTMGYRGTRKGLRQIARELGVGSVLEGELQSGGGRVRIHARLVDAGADELLWAGQYEEGLSDLLSVQAEVSREVASALTTALSSSETGRLGQTSTRQLDAYTLYLKGRHAWRQRGSGLRAGLEWFRRALEVDPRYALALTGIADCYTLLGFFGEMEPRRAMTRARDAASRALEIDEGLAEARTALAFVRAYFDWDLPGAEEEFSRAINLNPSYAPAHYFRAGVSLLRRQEDEAVARSRRALELDPHSPFVNAHLGWMLAASGRFEAARRQLRRTLTLDPRFPLTQWLLGWTSVYESRPEEAIPSFENAAALSDGLPWFTACLGWAYGTAGRTDEAQRVLSGLRERRGTTYVRSLCFALVHAGLGEVEEALDALDEALEERDPWVPGLESDRFFEPLESEPRFLDLIGRVRSGSSGPGLANR